MDACQQVGQRLRHLRQVRGYTQEQLAERIEISPKYLSSIERGAENPTLNLLSRLAQGLQVDLYDVATNPPTRPPAHWSPCSDCRRRARSASWPRRRAVRSMIFRR